MGKYKIPIAPAKAKRPTYNMTDEQLALYKQDARRELYDAMGFPHDYIIDRDVDGRPIKKADQVARCGNAVCPAVSEAMVRANLPECSTTKYGSMEALHEAMSS